jgi:hypothetical protein
MNKILLICLILSASYSALAQTAVFREETDVMMFMEDKRFYNSDQGLEIQYGYISSYNTYGIKVKNRNGAQFYFINVDIKPYGSFADFVGMSPVDGANLSFRLYQDKLIVGRGESVEVTFYLQ